MDGRVVFLSTFFNLKAPPSFQPLETFLGEVKSQDACGDEVENFGVGIQI